MSDIRDTGTIDWFLIEAQDKQINGELVAPLIDLVDRRLIRILDALVLVKRADGDFDARRQRISTRRRSAISVRWPAHRRACCPTRMRRRRRR
jgi:hypothetical protein